MKDDDRRDHDDGVAIRVGQALLPVQSCRDVRQECLTYCIVPGCHVGYGASAASLPVSPLAEYSITLFAQA